MFPFWKTVLEPILEAANARRVVEIGALAGENTKQLLDAMSNDAELHVIDPVPQFDPEEHRRQFGGRYVFHQDLSHNVLPHLEAMDVAFIDGDHNWYTVYHELAYLAERSRSAGQPLPICILHDTFWPYGRRDLYYDPSTVPEDQRQPYDTKGMRPGRSELAARGGLNPTMYNALSEGGPRNGVMTALDDFLASFDEPYRRLDIPIYFGLSIVVETKRLEQTPKLIEVLDHLESPAGKDDLLHLAEETRLRAMMFQHNVFFNQQQKDHRARDRYLRLVKDALVNRHYIEHELRIGYLVERVQRKERIDNHMLRDPARPLKGRLRTLRMRRRFGTVENEEGKGDSWYPYAASVDRLERLALLVDDALDRSIPGDLVDVEPGRGGTSIYLRAALAAREIEDRSVWCVGRFHAGADLDGHLGPDVNTVRDGFDAFDLLDEKVRFLQGQLPSSLAGSELGEIAFLRIGGEDPNAVTAALEALYPRLAPGATVMLDSYSEETAAAATAFRERVGEHSATEHLNWSGLIWNKTITTAAVPTSRNGPPLDRILLARKRAGEASVALSVIVVFYNMRREAARTLYSLSRRYQEDLDGVDYEVIAIDNGSDPDQRLTEADVQAYGPEFRFVDMGENAPSTPVPALARGLDLARGDALAFMIDGAHVLSPKVLSLGLLGLDTYGPAIVATQQWYVGPGEQSEAMLEGYDEEYEDRLFEEIEWPSNGYRLFEISSFIGDRDWFDGLWESNCLFASRSIVEQVGAFDDSFSMAGGGFANLDLFERLGSSPDASVVTILGEGSFHQTHGGTTTNVAEIAERRSRIVDYRAHYEKTRGRPFRGPGKMVRYVGTLFGPSKRSKPRRLMSPYFARAAEAGGTDDQATKRMPMPEEMKTAFTDAFWHTNGWRETNWMGEHVERAPTDLISYQEIVNEVRPDLIVTVESPFTGSVAPFFAALCRDTGHGIVVAVGTGDLPDESDRLTTLSGSANDDEVQAHVREALGEGTLMVVIGLNRVKEVTQTFGAYGPLVGPGSYVIIEDTIVNGNPVWTHFGPGPLEACRNILRTNGQFLSDSRRERFGLTFNPEGFLLHRTVPN